MSEEEIFDKPEEPKPKPPPKKQRLPIDRGRGNFANNWK